MNQITQALDQITHEALQRNVDSLNWADGGYYGWTILELVLILSHMRENEPLFRIWNN